MNLPAFRLKQRRDLLEVPSAGPGAMHADEDGLFGRGLRRVQGNDTGESEQSDQQADFHAIQVSQQGRPVNPGNVTYRLCRRFPSVRDLDYLSSKFS